MEKQPDLKLVWNSVLKSKNKIDIETLETQECFISIDGGERFWGKEERKRRKGREVERERESGGKQRRAGMANTYRACCSATVRAKVGLLVFVSTVAQARLWFKVVMRDSLEASYSARRWLGLAGSDALTLGTRRGGCN
ncbi:hypothetical protein Droror1_Dr00027954, partial [Drosera rotundifolia]